MVWADTVKRRDFMAILAGSAATWPLVAVGQPRVPVIGFLGPQAPVHEMLATFDQGLRKWGYFTGRNVTFEYRWARDQGRQLAALAAELVQLRVNLIVTAGGLAAAKAAKKATTTIPILFTSGLDPVENGVVASLNRPGGNATGLSQSYKEEVPKRLELLKQIVPNARRFAYLQNDDITGLGPSERMQYQRDTEVASKLGLTIYVARNETEIEAAFGAMARQGTDTLLVPSDPLFGYQRTRIVALAARHALPAGYARREFVDAGGLMSYGASHLDAWRQIGEYAGRILNGAKPEELPVQVHNQYELVINMKTAERLGLAVPPLLHGLADEVIE
jgi:putative ABC transport system substrate-binding protein